MKYLVQFSLLILSLGSTSVLSAEQREWRFKVSLDDREIGSQVYTLEHQGARSQLQTRAEFKVKLLFVTVFSYLHENTEAWDGPCLAEIDSITDSNGKDFKLSGNRGKESFIIRTAEETRKLPDCVMTFAYWRPDFLGQDKLLNPQTGEYIQVRVSEPEADQRVVRGKTVPSLRYRLQADQLDLQLWYSLDDEWLALESRTESDKILKYELM